MITLDHIHETIGICLQGCPHVVWIGNKDNWETKAAMIMTCARKEYRWPSQIMWGKSKMKLAYSTIHFCDMGEFDQLVERLNGSIYVIIDGHTTSKDFIMDKAKQGIGKEKEERTNALKRFLTIQPVSGTKNFSVVTKTEDRSFVGSLIKTHEDYIFQPAGLALKSQWLVEIVIMIKYINNDRNAAAVEEMLSE